MTFTRTIALKSFSSIVVPSQAYCQHFTVFLRVQNATGGQMTHCRVPLPSKVLLSGLRLLFLGQLDTISCRFPLYCFLAAGAQWVGDDRVAVLPLLGEQENSDRDINYWESLHLGNCRQTEQLWGSANCQKMVCFSWGLNNSRSETGHTGVTACKYSQIIP